MGLRSLDLPSLRRIRGYFWMASNYFHGSFGLPSLVQVDGSFVVRASAGISSMSDVGSLAHVGGGITLTDNMSLDGAAARAWAANIEVQGRVLVCGNASGDDVCPP
jgi:hypothetical protein